MKLSCAYNEEGRSDSMVRGTSLVAYNALSAAHDTGAKWNEQCCSRRSGHSLPEPNVLCLPDMPCLALRMFIDAQNLQNTFTRLKSAPFTPYPAVSSRTMSLPPFTCPLVDGPAFPSSPRRRFPPPPLSLASCAFPRPAHTRRSSPLH
ncbi:hypothetical protein HYPSUDRAFT_215896 [Hypholoma sublateritium FD-334 SS-4]|uniref:Uncharacterized protein n=1 Tax=Hypholoma sublateritium (strain FD-334 SS-4) TaxID=945553 RepID=A0A0D2PR37_HYPSF|nr:hypothetical protein HYPSUDRAFT_215896 [Hypholoma sublateritium FD-334 SS-4]